MKEKTRVIFGEALHSFEQVEAYLLFLDLNWIVDRLFQSGSVCYFT